MFMLSLATSRRPSSLPSICEPIWEIIISRCEGAIWLSIMQSEYLSDSQKLPASISICIGLCRTPGGKMLFTSGRRLLNGVNQCATDWKNEKPLSAEKVPKLMSIPSLPMAMISFMLSANCLLPRIFSHSAFGSPRKAFAKSSSICSNPILLRW